MRPFLPGGRAPGRRPFAALAVAAALALTATACGSRLPERDFAPEAPAATTRSANTASDVGVTPTTIKIGLIATLSGLLGPDTFSGPSYGVQAFVRSVNAAGGINGRMLELVTCDDEGTGYGNQRCARRLVDDEKVFAFAGNTALRYDGAAHISDRGVPDIGGQPIGNAYDQYPHLYSIYGSSAPRNGTLGWNGTLYASTEIYRYFKDRLGARTAGVVYYNQADSTRYARTIADGLRAEGYTVVEKQVDFALPNFAAAAVDMARRGVDIVFDAIDTRGNADLCRAMDGAGLRPQAKVTNVQNWNARLGADFRDSPGCRNTIQATGSSRNYEDVGHPEVKAFRDAMRAYFPDREDRMSQWELEGWAAGRWVADAIASCGEKVTRACVEAFVGRPEGYDARGLLLPARFVALTEQQAAAPRRACLNVARWQDTANGGRGGWADQVPDLTTNCFDVPALPYRP